MDRSPQTVLIVSQKESQTSQLCACLQRAGYRVSVAVRGQRALEVIRRERPDLAILEWPLPDINSLSLVRAIRADPELAQLPIILRAEAMKEDDFLLALEAGADACLREPFHPAIFIARVRAVLRRCHLYQKAA